MIAQNTLRLQIVLSVIVIMITSSIVIIYFVCKDTNDNFKKLSKDSIGNISNFIETSLDDNFNYFVRHKYAYIKRKKDYLKKDIEFILHLHNFSNGKIEYVLGYYSKLKRKNFILLDNYKGDVIFSTDHSLDKYVKEKKHSMNEQFIVNRLSHRIEFFKRKKNFTIFTYYDISEFNNMVDDKIKEIKNDLKEILYNIKIEKEGFLFIFDRKNNQFIQSSNRMNQKCLQEIIDIENSREKNIYNNFYSCDDKLFAVKKEYFKGFDWNFGVVIPKSEIEKLGYDLAKSLMIMIILIIVFTILFLVFFISKAIKPLAILSKKISKVAKHDFTLDDHSELLDGLPVTAHNEVGQLAKNFSFMIRELSDSIKRLVETTAANERMESELNIARKIQLEILPKDFSEIKRKGADIHAYLNPARQIGGDLYDFFFIDEDHLCFTVGDVADKGVPAALFMFWIKKMISNYAVKGDARRLSPAEIMGEINEMACKDNASATFITLFIGILNIKNGEMRYANGGHVPPIFVDCGSEPKYRKDRSGPAVGVNSEIRYRDIAAVLRPGGAVFLCTDGVTEAMNEEDKLFGDKRLLDGFSCLKNKSCKEVVEGILYEVKKHAGTAPQSDDIAMLMLRLKDEDKNNHV